MSCHDALSWVNPAGKREKEGRGGVEGGWKEGEEGEESGRRGGEERVEGRKGGGWKGGGVETGR